MADPQDPREVARNFVMETLKGFDFGLGNQALNKLMDERAAMDRGMAETIARVFRSEDGQKVLAWLKALTTDKAKVTRDLILTLNRDQLAAFTCFREGENSVVELIEDAIADAAQKPRRRRSPV